MALGLLALLLLVPIVDDHLEPEGLGSDRASRGSYTLGKHIPFLIIKVGLFLLQAGGLRLHELVERGQFLPAPRGGPPWKRLRWSDGRDGRGGQGMHSRFLGACFWVPFCPVVVTMAQCGIRWVGVRIRTWADWNGAKSTPAGRLVGGEG